MPTRQIAWNVGEVAVAAMYALLAVQGLLLAYGITRRYLMWRRGQPVGPLAANLIVSGGAGPGGTACGRRCGGAGTGGGRGRSRWG